MQFETWTEFFQMGGYGFFVWLAFGVTFLSMFIIGVQSFLESKQLQKEVLKVNARKQRIAAAQEK